MLAASEKLSWFISRSSGWVAAVLLALTVIWGVLGSSRLIERRGVPRWLQDLHRYLALLTVFFIAVHLLALVGDNYMHIGWRELFVPYALRWKPGAVAWGVVALYCIAVVQVSSWLRPWLPRALWRRVHYLSYPALWMALVHGLKAGTDANNIGIRLGVIVLVALTAFTTAVRILGTRERRKPVVARRPVPAADSVLAASPAPAAGPVSTLPPPPAGAIPIDAPTLADRAVSSR